MLNEALTPRQQRGLMLAATAHIRRRQAACLTCRRRPTAGQLHRGDSGADRSSAHARTTNFGTAVQTLLRRGIFPEARNRRRWHRDGRDAHRARHLSAELARLQPGADHREGAFCTLLRDLVADVPSPEQKRGRPALPLSDMLFSAAFKVYSTCRGRRFMTDLREAAAKERIDRTPHYNTHFQLPRKPRDAHPQELITRSARCRSRRWKRTSPSTRPDSAHKTSIGISPPNTAGTRCGASSSTPRHDRLPHERRHGC